MPEKKLNCYETDANDELHFQNHKWHKQHWTQAISANTSHTSCCVNKCSYKRNEYLCTWSLWHTDKDCVSTHTHTHTCVTRLTTDGHTHTRSGSQEIHTLTREAAQMAWALFINLHLLRQMQGYFYEGVSLNAISRSQRYSDKRQCVIFIQSQSETQSHC